MTSVSSIKVPSGEEDGIPVHCYRKIGHARRRQYVDRPTSAKSRSVMDIAKCQTESPVTTNIQSQVSITDLKIWILEYSNNEMIEYLHYNIGICRRSIV